jgi:hypothetical protein
MRCAPSGAITAQVEMIAPLEDFRGISNGERRLQLSMNIAPKRQGNAGRAEGPSPIRSRVRFVENVDGRRSVIAAGCRAQAIAAVSIADPIDAKRSDGLQLDAP